MRGQLFGRFTRAGSENGADRGVGLGLAIVDAVAKAHGGHCDCSATPEGSIFTLVLPSFVAVSPAVIET
jgi:signal transduction histidine kinase